MFRNDDIIVLGHMPPVRDDSRKHRKQELARENVRGSAQSGHHEPVDQLNPLLRFDRSVPKHSIELAATVKRYSGARDVETPRAAGVDSDIAIVDMINLPNPCAQGEQNVTAFRRVYPRGGRKSRPYFAGWAETLPRRPRPTGPPFPAW